MQKRLEKYVFRVVNNCAISSKINKVAYNLGVLGHFAPWDSFGLSSIRKFWAKKSDKHTC